MANQVAGFIGAIMAALLWGSFAVPIKLVETGDGFIFQWVRLFRTDMILLHFVLAVVVPDKVMWDAESLTFFGKRSASFFYGNRWNAALSSLWASFANL